MVFKKSAGCAKYSKEKRKINWEEHLNWIMPIILEKTSKNLFVIWKENLPIGQIRFDYLRDKEARISIAILKEFRGKGVGGESFKRAVKLLKKEKKVKSIIAEVHKDNIASQEFFEKLNFQLKEKNKWLKYALKL